ncbi:MAG: HlyC/CorC family transporter [Chlamydiae bacterium]|nr:HlyC/CorC family transporter [Chlamydiota bacterium]
MGEESWRLFLMLILASIVVEAFFAMMEMACVSFNRVRLQYYVSQGYKRALWISFLLDHPTRLFGTTLIGVNAALQFGSECARRFYLSLGLSPDWAPLSQVLLVLILAELAPIFAARRYAEHVAMLGIPLIYVLCKLMTPFVWVLNGLCFVLHRLLQLPPTQGVHLTREELQKAIESRGEEGESGDFDTVAASIFSLKSKTAKDLMVPIEKSKVLPSSCLVEHVVEALEGKFSPYLPVFHMSKQNIVAMIYPRDLLRASDKDSVRQFAKQPWFILEKNSIFQILKQFRKNNQRVAVVLNESGLATGILSLDAIVEEIFGTKLHRFVEKDPYKDQVIIEKSFPGDIKVIEINRQLNIYLPAREGLTLEELMTDKLGHRPNKGDAVRFDQFELTMEEAGLLKGKKISVRTVF